MQIFISTSDKLRVILFELRPHKIIILIIIRRSISMRAGPAFLQFDWSKAGLSIDLPVFVSCQSSYLPIRTLASNFFQDGEDIGQLFMWLQVFYFKPRRENLTGPLFCLDLSLSRSTDHRDRNLH